MVSGKGTAKQAREKTVLSETSETDISLPACNKRPSAPAAGTEFVQGDSVTGCGKALLYQATTLALVEL
jgi:hypothetical protein